MQTLKYSLKLLSKYRRSFIEESSTCDQFNYECQWMSPRRIDNIEAVLLTNERTDLVSMNKLEVWDMAGHTRK